MRDCTLIIYSGRPDPIWQLSEEQAKELEALVTHLAKGDTFIIFPRLGYRGAKVNLDRKKITVLHDKVRVDQTYPHDPHVSSTEYLADPTLSVQNYILQTAGGHISDQVIEGIKGLSPRQGA